VNLISKKLSSFKLFAAIFGLSIAALPGCGYNEADLCNDTCDCKGCSAIEYDNCIDDAEDLGREVEFQGCEVYYDDYLDCLGSEFACRNGNVDLDGCGGEFQRLFNCLD
jgi:hypothetical protein